MGGVNLVDLDLGGIIDGVMDGLDGLFTSDEERLQAKAEATKLVHTRLMGQLAINKQEAAHKSIFVAGWRPAIGWTCAASLAYNFIGQPLLVYLMECIAVWKDMANMPYPPTLDIESLMSVVMAMLGMAGLRTYEKQKGVTK